MSPKLQSVELKYEQGKQNKAIKDKLQSVRIPKWNGCNCKKKKKKEKKKKEKRWVNINVKIGKIYDYKQKLLKNILNDLCYQC